jgi:phosphate starvation-inducible protein PhoH and related proteins
LSNQSEILLTIEEVDLVELFGENNIKLGLLRQAFPDLTITARGNALRISGEKTDAQRAKTRFELMVRALKEFKELKVQTVEDIMAGNNPFVARLSETPLGNNDNVIVHGRDGKPIKAKTINQKKMVDAVDANDIVFAVGPAGTGKTYTAVALAVRALKNKLVKKIVLTRPAVEAGENLGFLPGDLKDKVDPYLRPLYDALDDMFPADKLAFFMENRTIEIAPLAYMRGRTLDNAFIILDEAQNSTPLQLKMFLTRLGPSAKCVITGDLTQVDLPYNQRSGLQQGIDILSGINGIAVTHLTIDDVVRHRLVKEIIKAYGKMEEEAKERRENTKKNKEDWQQKYDKKDPEMDDEKKSEK